MNKPQAINFVSENIVDSEDKHMTDSLEDVYLINDSTDRDDTSMDDSNETSLERSQVVHVHDRLIDKDNALHIYNMATTFEDKIFTQKFKLDKRSPIHAFRMLMDLGANRSATCFKELLEDYQEIPHKTIGGANKETGDITVEGFGYIPWYTPTNQKLLIKCYYSPDLIETIVSPTDVVLTQKAKYRGFTIHSDIIIKKGYIKYLNIDGICHAQYPIEMHNGLWYFVDTGLTDKEARLRTKRSAHAIINKLSTAATYELWHQRLGHPGQTTMKEIHHYVQGIPQLKGNAFHRCLSCTLAKMSKQPSVQDKQNEVINNTHAWKGEYTCGQCKNCAHYG